MQGGMVDPRHCLYDPRPPPPGPLREECAPRLSPRLPPGKAAAVHVERTALGALACSQHRLQLAKRSRLVGLLIAAMLLLAKALRPLPPSAVSLVRGAPGATSRWRGLSNIIPVAIVVVVMVGSPQPADAFTCPTGCVCGYASDACVYLAYSDGNAALAAKCADCQGASTIPALTTDTYGLLLVSSPNLAPVIGAPGFQFPSSWSALKVL